MYKGNSGFLSYRLTLEQWDPIVNFVSSFSNNNHRISIGTQGITKKTDIFDHVDNKNKLFQKRGLCSGNITSLFILPDGKVTICEELYWSPKFIIGDVSTQSIQEVWESRKAINLYKLSQQDFRDTSACKYCPVFKECRAKLGVCWKMIFQAYGMEAWDLPDPRCPLAPTPVNEFYR